MADGYTTRSGRHGDIKTVVLVGAQAYAATFNGAGVETADRGTLCLNLDVTAITGTLDVAIQTSKDGVTWRAVATFAQASGVTSERKSFVGIDRFVRAVCTIGTGPATFSVKGDAK